MIADAEGNAAKRLAEKIIGNIPRDKINDKGDRFGICTAVTAAKDKVENYNECQRIEYRPDKAKKIADVFFFKIPQT